MHGSSEAKAERPFGEPCTGAAWLSSARVVRCWVKSRNERNPCRQLQVSSETAGIKPEEGGDDVKSAWPLYPGLHTRYNGQYNGQRKGDLERIPTKLFVVQIVGCNPPT